MLNVIKNNLISFCLRRNEVDCITESEQFFATRGLIIAVTNSRSHQLAVRSPNRDSALFATLKFTRSDKAMRCSPLTGQGLRIVCCLLVGAAEVATSSTLERQIVLRSVSRNTTMALDQLTRVIQMIGDGRWWHTCVV